MRPRQHELKSESELAFAQLIPSGWVVRRQNDEDYGIDAEVEIFRDGDPTGYSFKVQLKSTDSTGRRTVPIKLKTLSYWNSLDVPVLVVYYVAPTKQLYGVWAHAHDLHLRTSSTPSKTTAFAFPDASLLETETVADRLEQDVRRVRDVQRGLLPGLMTYSLTFDETYSQSAGRHLAMRQLTTNSSLRPADNADDADLRFHLTRELLRVIAPVDIASFTVHSPQFANQADDAFAYDAVVAGALVLAAIGVESTASELFLLGRPSRLLDDPQVALTATACLADQRRFVESFDLAADRFLSEQPSTRDAGSILLSQAVANLSVDEPPLGDTLLALMETRIEIEQRQGRRARAGRAYYNLGQLLFARRDEVAALDALINAAEYDPEYLRRDYYFRERAALEWDLRMYDASSRHYQMALDLGGDPAELHPLLGDALLRAGRYGAARDLLANWDDQEVRLDRLAGVVHCVADLAVRTTGLLEQNRRPPSSAEITAMGEPPSPSICWQYLTDVDVLEPRLWQEAFSLVPSEDIPAVLVLMAHILDGVAAAWAAATAAAVFTDPDSRLVRQLIDSGHARTGTEFVTAIENQVGTLTSDEDQAAADLLQTTVMNRLATRPDHRLMTVMRFIHTDADDAQG